MSSYRPDKWTIVYMGEDVYKVLGGWSGGYLDGDEWRLSSGLKRIEEKGDYYLMHNHSGSIYECHKNGEGMTILSCSIYSKIQGLGDEVKIVTVEEFNEASKHFTQS